MVWDQMNSYLTINKFQVHPRDWSPKIDHLEKVKLMLELKKFEIDQSADQLEHPMFEFDNPLW